MTTLQDKMQNIYRVKREIKSALGTDSDVFSEYPDMIRSVAEDKVSYSYLDERLSYYVELTDLESMSYATESYVMDAIGNIPSIDTSSYVSYTYLSDNYLPLNGGEISGQFYVSYSTATTANYGIKSYSHVVAGDHNKTGVTFFATKRKCGGAEGTSYMASFFTNSDGRSKFAHKSQTNNVDVGGEVDDAFMCFNAYGFKIAYSGIQGTSASTEYELIHEGNLSNYIPTINENIIPKENNTYTLGDIDHLYNSAYATDLYMSTKNKISNRSDNQINIMLNNGWKYTFHSNGITPVANQNQNLGASANPWYATYTSYLYLNGSDINEIFPTYAYVTDYVDSHSGGGGSSVVIDENIIPKENNTYTLGDSTYKYAATYTNAAYLSSSNVLYNQSSNQVNLDLGSRRFVFASGSFFPSANTNLGKSDRPWAYTYTNNLIINGTDIEARIAAIEAYLGLNQTT